MEDRQIIELYWKRAEDAIRETDVKYGRLCHYIAQNILASPEDSEECVNDTWLGLWNAIPPQRPSRLSAFVGRITRNLALKRFDYLTAAKRSPEAICSLEELGDCVSGRASVEDELENRRMEEAIDTFLKSKTTYAPGKAVNAGGVATSGLEMSQNAEHLQWSAEEVDRRLHEIMRNIHTQCVKHGTEPDGYINYMKGANIAGFMKVANAMMGQGII